MSQVELTQSVIRPEDLLSWLPVDATIDNGRPMIEWMELSDIDFCEPFFSQTIERVKSGGDRKHLLTEFDFLLRTEKVFDSIEPSGFIFHSSRCGSTLVANACRG